MLADLIALADKPLVLLVVMAFGAAIGIGVERLVEGQKRAKRRAYWHGRNASKKQSGQNRSAAPRLVVSPQVDAADQLRIVMAAAFNARPLLNKPERRLLAHLDRILAEETPGWRPMGQVSLGEILASDDKDGYLAINSKRVDLLIIDADSQPLHAVEFQGQGHHQGTAAARDAVKREALRRAGIGYVEVVTGDTPAELRAMVRKLAGCVSRNDDKASAA